MALEIQLMLICKVHSSFEAFIIYLLKKAKWIWGQTLGKTLQHSAQGLSLGTLG